MRVVFDTNVVASATFWRGAPFDCLAAWAQGRCEAVVSPALLAEYHETIAELRLDYPERTCVEWVEALAEICRVFFPVKHAAAGHGSQRRNESEFALAAKADFIVSGDKNTCLCFGNSRASRL